jgi:putative ABC transport system permease protein
MKRSLRSWLWRVPVDQEIDEEIALHVEMRTRELVERGIDPIAARKLALGRLGDVERLKQTCVDLSRRRDRSMRLGQWFEELRDDVKVAIRQLLGSPVFTTIAVTTLALGIGANSAIFALVDATLLRPLPFREPGRLVMLWERSETRARGLVSPLNMLDWNDRARSFEKIAGFVPEVGGMVMAGTDGTAETVPRQWVSGGIFEVLGIKAVAGRTFLAEDETSKSRVVVLSEAFWRTRFAADPSVIGRDLRLDGLPFTVVGVVPEEAQLIGRSSIWAMVPLAGRAPSMRAPRVLQVIGRLKKDATLDAARSELSTVADGLAREFPATNKGRSVTLEPLHVAMIGRELRLTSMLFLGVVGFVLLICCANVANLLLARATVRVRELAVRSALGAGRPRLVRQLLTESLVLAWLGGVAGVAVGFTILNVAPSVIPEQLLPGAVNLTFDARVAAFCAVAALLVGLLFGLAPAWQATEFSPARVIASNSRSHTGRSGKMRSLLVVGEVAAATLVLCGAGLLLRTLLAIEHVDRGYRADRLLTMMVDPLGAKYPKRELLQQFYQSVEDEVKVLPGVRSVAWASTLPFGTSILGRFAFYIEGEPVVDENKRPVADYQLVSPSYFQTIDLPMVAGRAFTDRDTSESPPVCIVNEAFVRVHLPGQSPIGRRVAVQAVSLDSNRPVVREIVGVARQVKSRPDELEEMLQIYVPTTQDGTDDTYLIVRSDSGPAEALASSVRAAIGRVDREQLVSVREILTLDEVAAAATARHRFRAVMVTTFAVLALVLAMVGVFGILAYSVQQRVREFGVRMALGATLNDVLGVVVGNAVRVVAAGIVLGFALAALLGRLLKTVLFGVEPLDPLTFVSVGIVLTVTAAIATAAPAWRAARIDPVVALRGE